MEIESGTCSLCLESTDIIKNYIYTIQRLNCLSKFKKGNFLPNSVFQRIKSSLKICLVCDHKLELLEKYEVTISAQNTIRKTCAFCPSHSNLIEVPKNSNFLDGKINIWSTKYKICSKCVFYFDALFTIRKNLLTKYPQLSSAAQALKGSPKKRKADSEESDSPSSSPKRSCFVDLRTLFKSDYKVARHLKRNPQIFKKIPYVDLSNDEISLTTTKSKNKLVLETPKKGIDQKSVKKRPQIKIKLKVKKAEAAKSDQIPKKRRTLRRFSDEKDWNNGLDETPKAHSGNLEPKRRVSGIAEPDSNNEESASNSASNDNEIGNIVEKYINESIVDTENLLAELRTSGVDKEKDKEVETEKSEEEDDKKIERPGKESPKKMLEEVEEAKDDTDENKDNNELVKDATSTETTCTKSSTSEESKSSLEVVNETEDLTANSDDDCFISENNADTEIAVAALKEAEDILNEAEASLNDSILRKEPLDEIIGEEEQIGSLEDELDLLFLPKRNENGNFTSNGDTSSDELNKSVIIHEDVILVEGGETTTENNKEDNLEDSVSDPEKKKKRVTFSI